MQERDSYGQILNNSLEIGRYDYTECFPLAIIIQVHLYTEGHSQPCLDTLWNNMWRSLCVGVRARVRVRVCMRVCVRNGDLIQLFIWKTRGTGARNTAE